MRQLKSLIDRKDRILLTGEDDLLSDVSKLEKGLRDRILAILRKLDTADGRFTETAYNQRLILQLEKEVRNYMSSARFTSPMDKYLTQFDKLDDINAQIFATTTGSFKQKAARALIGGARLALVDTIADSLTNPQSITSSILPAIKRVAYKSILLGITYKDAENEFLSLLPRDGSAGIVQRYTTQIVRDTINQYDGTIQKKVADEVGLNAFMFVGSIIETSRPGCIHMVNAPAAVEICKGSGKNRVCQVEANRFAEIVLPNGGYRVEDIPIIISKNRNDKGWIEGTTPDTYFTNRNGYNCRHQTIPFFQKDAEKIEEALN